MAAVSSSRRQSIPGRIGKVACGVCRNGDDAGNFDDIAGVEVTDFSDLPRGFSRLRIAEQRYAVFTHGDHISSIRRTVNTIWNHWLPISGSSRHMNCRDYARPQRGRSSSMQADTSIRCLHMQLDIDG
jgi:predicted transcriptional regulator YdeE